MSSTSTARVGLGERMVRAANGLLLALVSCAPSVAGGHGSGGGDGSGGGGSTSTGFELSTGGATSSSGEASSSSTGGPGPAMVEGDCTTVIEDPALALFVWSELGLPPGSVIPSETLAGLEGVDAWGLGIETLAGLECAVGLIYVGVGPGDNDEANFVTDLSPLSELPVLETVTMWGNPISDLSPLATVGTLRRLNIRETEVVDLSPIAGLPIEQISANGAPIESVEPLAACTTLRSVGVDGTHVTDLSPLVALPELDDVLASNTEVADVGVFAGKELDALHVRESLVDALPANLTLRSAQFDGNGIVDLSPLLTWSQPGSVSLVDNAIDDPSSLLDAEWTAEGYGDCVHLDLTGNPLRHPDAAAALQQLCATVPVVVRADGELSCRYELEDLCLPPT